MPSTNREAPHDADPYERLLKRAQRHGVFSAFGWLLECKSADSFTALELGSLHERLIDALHGSRRKSGAYYTPPALVELLLDEALEPVVSDRVSAALGRVVRRPEDLSALTSAERRAAADAIRGTTVLDPACGAGAFLEAAARRIFHWLGKASPASAGDDELRLQIATRCLFGIDADETAVLLTRFAVGSEIAGHVHCGDSLLDPSPWPNRRFDVVVGNPPFANAIEGLVDQASKEGLAKRYPDLRGTADLSFYFLAAAHSFAEEEGAVGFVLPRTALSAPAATRLRERLLGERPPAFLFTPSDPMLFPGANVFVSLVVLKRGDECVTLDEDGSRRRLELVGENWWRAIHAGDAWNDDQEGLSVGDVFEVHGSMTTGEAYALLPFLIEGDDESSLRFITTGLIDPGVCLWGNKTCRYLGRRFQRPTVNTATIPEPLARRVSRMRRPKVLVAGLSTRVEAFLDVRGDHIGAVSTYSLIHPNDDLKALADLCDRLNSDATAERLRRELGATALGGGRITLTKRFLKELPVELAIT